MVPARNQLRSVILRKALGNEPRAEGGPLNEIRALYISTDSGHESPPRKPADLHRVGDHIVVSLEGLINGHVLVVR